MSDSVSLFPGVWDYIETARDMVHDLEMRVQKAKDNVEKLQKIMASWSKTSLFERKEGKNESLLNLDDRNDRLKKRYNEIEAAGQQLHTLLDVCVSFLHHCCLVTLIFS